MSKDADTPQASETVPKRHKLTAGLRSLLFGDERLEHWTLMILALITGVLAAYGAILFYLAIDFILRLFFGVGEEGLTRHAENLDWYVLLTVPVFGGLIVGQLLRFMPSSRAYGVPHVMESAALQNGRLKARHGFLSAGITVLSLGTGASAGREGPVVHLGATLASWVTRRFHMPPKIGRILLGCGVAAAVSASFNAPIAGVFFALEVIIGHYALHAFTPIVISAVVGTLISRAHLGIFPAFALSDHIAIASAWEFPAFFLLGIASALVASGFMACITKTEGIVEHRLAGVPSYLLPAIGGLILGFMALFLPEILSVGYDAVSNVLNIGADGSGFTFLFLVTLLVYKIIATSVTLAARFGGGVFSPSLFIGAMTGGAFGMSAAWLVPSLASAPGLYAVVGMGAVASAVLGAPISTILIVFEITGDYSITIAVMIACSVSSLVTSIFYERSFFHQQLRAKGVHLEGGRATYLLKSVQVRKHLERDFFTITADDTLAHARDMLLAQDGGKLIVTDVTGAMAGVITLPDLPPKSFSNKDFSKQSILPWVNPNPVTLKSNDLLETALNRMASSGEDILPVVTPDNENHVIGIIKHYTVLKEYNRALMDTHGSDKKYAGED